MSWKVHETDDVFAALRGLCSNSYRMYDPEEYRYYYDHDCDAYECAVENAAEEYERLLAHCNHQREQLARYEKKEDGMDNIDGGTEIERIRSSSKVRAGSSITDELRDWVSNHYSGWPSKQAEGYAIADRIDERHAKARDEAYNEGVYDGIDADKNAMGYIKLPVDADGEPIHVGDYVETLIEAFKGERGRVECLALTEDGWEVDGEAPSTVRHVKPDSWERIIEDAGMANALSSEWDNMKAELVERCKRLAGE